MSTRALLAAGAATVVVVAAGIGAWLLLDDDEQASAAAPPPTQHFVSRPDLQPPPITVERAGATALGLIFLAPKKDVLQAGPMIVDPSGKLVWFHPLDTHGVADFKVQTYGGRPVLTWWRGRAEMGVGDGYYVIISNTYHEIARVSAGDGLAGDIHEFLITPQNTALITVYHRIPRDLSDVGGPSEGSIYDGIVQELDITTGEVLFEWHSADHVAVAESYADPPKASRGADADPYDYFHINSIDAEPDGNLLLSARNTRAVYEIDRSTGNVIWRLGGKKSDFAMGPGTRFAWQHDARRQPDGTITLFDNEADPEVEAHSRAIVLSVDTVAHEATLVRSYLHPDGLLAGSQGNAQFLRDGHVFVGWGAQPYFTEFDDSGNVVLDGHIGAGADNYRAFHLPWIGNPTDRPAAVITRSENGDLRVSASWNGATEVDRWQVIAGSDAADLHPLGFPRDRTGFETTVALPGETQAVQVRALDQNGTVLGTSPTVEAPAAS